MKLPTKVKIFYKTYKFKYVNGYIISGTDDLLNGRVSFEEKLIEINVDQPHYMVKETIVHELVHVVEKEMAISGVLNHEHGEDITNGYSVGFTDMIIRNNWGFE